MSMAIKQGFSACKTFAGICWGLLLAIPAVVLGQTNYYATNGTEYAIVGSLPGDQVHSDVAVNTNGGFVVWQDNATDGSGWGISATRLESDLSTNLLTWSDHRVNSQGAGDQENPQVALLQGGGAVFVWQGGQKGFQHIYARFLSSSNIWLTGDVMVNASTNYFQIDPAVATLANGNVVFVWSSFDEASYGARQPTSMQDVYGRIFSPAGVPLTDEFLINQFTPFNQRNSTVAALADGGFVVAWVSEQEQTAFNLSGINNTNGTLSSQIGVPSANIYARLYDNGGNPQSDEFRVDTDSNTCDNPVLAAGSDGGFVVAWDARDLASIFTNGLDIYARPYTSASPGGGGTVIRVNSHLYGDQYLPRISSIGTDYLIVWTSMGQDGSMEGVYGQFLHGNGSMVGGEFRVNTTTFNSQFQPVVASDGVSQFLAVWSGFTGLRYGFDLFSQRYLNTQQPLIPLPAPFVYAPFMLSNNVYQPQLTVSWSPPTGLSVSDYEVYMDGAATNMVTTTSNVWTMTAANGLTTNSTHSFRVDYVATDGRQSPKSPPTSGTTWGGQSWGGIPFEWMEKYYGQLVITFGSGGPVYNWTSPNVPLVSGGPTLLQVFLGGGDPTNSATWLQTTLNNTRQGLYLSWNALPGFTYQVQVSTNLVQWTNFAAPWFASDTNGWMYVGGHPAGYYRVMLLRQ